MGVESSDRAFLLLELGIVHFLCFSVAVCQCNASDSLKWSRSIAIFARVPSPVISNTRWLPLFTRIVHINVRLFFCVAMKFDCYRRLVTQPGFLNAIAMALAERAAGRQSNGMRRIISNICLKLNMDEAFLVHFRGGGGCITHTHTHIHVHTIVDITIGTIEKYNSICGVQLWIKHTRRRKKKQSDERCA